MSTSIPSLEDFDPKIIPTQIEVIRLVRRDYDYSKGPLEILLSGAVGSAKSILLAHLIATHALMYPGAGVLMGRRVLRDLKNTLLDMLIKHCPIMADYLNKSDSKISLPNGSVIYGVSWDDGNYKKFRSYPLSMAVIEEITENKEGEVYEEIKLRLGRLPHVPENVFISATNPDSPAHWAYKYFIDGQTESRRVFYSKTQDNPFLPKWYFDSMLKSLDPKMARRMLYGEWIEIGKEMIYYSYGDHNRIQDYAVDPSFPVGLTFDFNIGDGKPMSACAFQRIRNRFYFFEEFVVEGARTEDILEEMNARGLFNYAIKGARYQVFGDASGKHRDTRSRRSDYSIIQDFITNLEILGPDGEKVRIHCEMMVPAGNPPIRLRHNLMNASLKNAKEEVTLFVDAKCKVAHEGLRLTALKKGADIVEDDSKAFQHITTAMGYAVVKTLKGEGRESKMIQL